MMQALRSIRICNAAALVAGTVCLLVFLRALSCGFVNVDDPFIILQNPDIRSLDRHLLVRAFINPQDLWIPLAWLSLALDFRLWGLNPLGYHLTGIVLHAINTGLMVLVADRILRKRRDMPAQQAGSGGQAWLYPATLLLAGLLWGIHPLRVESVVWVSERKDVLNGLFSLATVLSYLRYVERRASGAAARTAYLLSLVLFSCSLMSKPVSVVLPLMLLVLDWYPLGRLRRGRRREVVAEKIPFLVLSAVTAALTVYFAARNSMLVAPETLPPFKRLIISGNAVMEYCRLLLYPVDIIHLYLIPAALPLSYYLKAVLTVALTVLAVAAIPWRPWIAAAWVLFLLPLLPVLAFFQNGGQAFAARYTYLPAAVFAITAASLIAAGYRGMYARPGRWQRVLVAGVMLVLACYAATTFVLIGTWRNTGALWSRFIQYHPIGSAYYFRSCHYKETGDYPAAAQDLTEAIRRGEAAGMTDVFKLYALRGDAYLKAGRYQESIRDFTAALSVVPQPAFYYHRGLAREASGDPDAGQDLGQAAGEVGPIEWYVNPVVK